MSTNGALVVDSTTLMAIRLALPNSLNDKLLNIIGRQGPIVWY